MAVRKRRMVYNAYVDIDTVTEQPGPNCNNWIKITKIKLQERESKLLKLVQDKIECIVNESEHLQSFTISAHITNATSAVLTKSINDWKGINLRRLKQPPSLYRDYYNVSKKSWDRRKTKLYAAALWVNVFKQIHRFVTNNLNRLLQILKDLFGATIKYNNTKAQPLISGCVISNSPEFQAYFDALDESFCIHEWIKEQKNDSVVKKRNPSKSIQKRMQSHLNDICKPKIQTVNLMAPTTTHDVVDVETTRKNQNNTNNTPIPPAPLLHQSPPPHVQEVRGYGVVRGPSVGRAYDKYNNVQPYPSVVHRPAWMMNQYPPDGCYPSRGPMNNMNSCESCSHPCYYCCNYDQSVAHATGNAFGAAPSHLNSNNTNNAPSTGTMVDTFSENPLFYDDMSMFYDDNNSESGLTTYI
eukprot:412500_1